MKRISIGAFVGVLLACVPAMGEEEPQPPVPVWDVTFSPDGKLLAVAYAVRNGAGGALLWDVENRKPVRVLRQDLGFTSVSFSPDGATLALSAFNSPPILLDVAGGAVLVTLEASRRGPVVFSPDGQTLAISSDHKTIHLWDVKARTDRQVLSGPKDKVYGKMVYSPDGSWLAAACGTDGVYVWDLTSEKPRHSLRHGSSFSRTVAFSPDSRWIITGGWDGTTRIWNAESGQVRARLGSMGGIDSLRMEPRSWLLAVGSGNRQIQLFDLLLDEPPDHALAKVRSLLSRFEDDRYDVREAASAELVKLGFVAEAELRKAAAESTSAEVRIRARRAREAILTQPQAQLSGHQSDVWCLAFSTDGQILASGSEDGTVRLWDVGKRTEIAHFTPAEVQ